MFSGTDNGIVNVKETVFFGVDKLKYRLRLHDHFQVLQNQGILMLIDVFLVVNILYFRRHLYGRGRRRSVASIAKVFHI